MGLLYGDGNKKENRVCWDVSGLENAKKDGNGNWNWDGLGEDVA